MMLDATIAPSQILLALIRTSLRRAARRSLIVSLSLSSAHPPVTLLNPQLRRHLGIIVHIRGQTVRAGSNTSSMEISHAAVGAIRDPTRQQLNWPLLVSLLVCLLFWGAVVFGIVAVV